MVVHSATEDGYLITPPITPDHYTESRIIELTTSAVMTGVMERLEKVRLYVTGNPDDVATVMSVWPFLGRQQGQPRRDELNGGLEISYDGGRTWQRFKYAANNADPDYPNYGNEADALGTDNTKWATIPVVALGLGATSGVLDPFTTARFLLRWKIPPGADQFHVFDVTLEAAFEIV